MTSLNHSTVRLSFLPKVSIGAKSVKIVEPLGAARNPAGAENAEPLDPDITYFNNPDPDRPLKGATHISTWVSHWLSVMLMTHQRFSF